MTQRTTLVSLTWLLLLAACPAPSWAVSEWSRLPAWSPVSIDQVRTQVVSALSQTDISASARDELAGQWRELTESASRERVLELVATTAAACHPEAAPLVEACRSPSEAGKLPDVSWLHDAEISQLFKYNLRLFIARWWMQEGYYDEALDLVAELSPSDVVDPATLLFCKAVCHHQLVEARAASSSAELLLERADEIPTRYEQLARLIAEDIKAVEEDSLDHIARRMNDIRRRLDAGRTDNKVIQIEDGVIESLDKLIDDLEEQRRRQQQRQQQSGGGQAPMRPMEQSMLPQGMQGPGNVDRRSVGNQSGWGALDDKAREEALQEVGREFPAHYRDVIEQYFKKIAAEDDTAGD